MQQFNAELEIVTALRKQASYLRKAKDPHRTIAAAKWEIRLADEESRLRGLLKERQGAESADLLLVAVRGE